MSIAVEPLEDRQHNWNSGADLEIQVPDGARVEIESISADLDLEQVRGSVSVESVSGRVRIRSAVSELEVASISGSVDIVNDASLRRGDFESVSASVDLKTAIDTDGRVDAESVSGTLTLRLPPGTCGEFELATFSGDIDNGMARRPGAPAVRARQGDPLHPRLLQGRDRRGVVLGSRSIDRGVGGHRANERR